MHAPTSAIVAQDLAPLSLSVDTLRAIVADLQRQYPAAGHRVEHAAMIVLFRRVDRSPSGAYYVQSEREPEQEYIVAGGQCTCQDYSRHGHLSPCKHQLSVKIAQLAERADAELQDPTPAVVIEVDVTGAPIPFTLTAAGLAAADDYRQRQAARCPECNRWKQHGDLYCGGDHCEQPPARLTVVA